MTRPWVLLLLAVTAAIVLAGTPFVGMERIPFSTLLHHGDDAAARIFWQLRLPRVVMAFLAGAGLAAGGLAFQAVFRNALAEPFTLGVASGAALGASAYIHLGLPFSLLWISGSSWFAFAGALLAVVLVYGMTRARQGFSTATMLLAGVAVSFCFSSLILFMQYLSDFTQSFLLLRWVMGGLHTVVGFGEVLTVLPLVVVGTAIVLYLTHELNLVTTGEELAASRGVAVNRTKVLLFVAVSLMVGGIVSVCGPIGFVGLIVPHTCRLLVGPDHRYLTPAALLCGAILLTLCDTLARTVMAPTELPVGILTSLLGGPFFLWLLLGRSPLGDTVC
jgi:iron complex transport system permease protein